MKPVLIMSSMIAFLILSCSQGNDTSSVTINFGTPVPAGMEDYIAVPASAAEIPDDVYSIEIRAYENNITTFAETFEKSEIASSDSITLEVPNGDNIQFKGFARNPQGLIIYTAQTTDNVDLSGGEATVDLVMKGVEVGTATVSVIETKNGSMNDLYPSLTLFYEVFEPTVIDDEVVLGEALNSGNSNPSGILVKPQTYQIILVRGMTSAGGFAVVGGAVITGLKKGQEETIEITMKNPTPIKITGFTGSGPYTIVDRGSGVVLYSGTYDDRSGIINARIPNTVKDYGKDKDPTGYYSADLKFGETTTPLFTNPFVIRWKEVEIDLPSL